MHFASSSEGIIWTEDVGSVWTDGRCRNVVSEIVLTRDSVFHRRVDEGPFLVGCYAENVSSCLLTFREGSSVPSSKVSSPCRWDRQAVQKLGEKLPIYTELQPRRAKTFIILTFAWKVRGKPQINLIFPKAGSY